jgi:hypothetical protein
MVSLYRAVQQAAKPCRLAAVTAFVAVSTLGSVAASGAAKGPTAGSTPTKHAGGQKPDHPNAGKARPFKARPMGHAETLLYFAKPVRTTLKSASGRVLKASAAPKAGDSLQTVDRDYKGSHLNHSRRAATTDSLTCKFTSTTAAKCTYVITVGGSQIAARDVKVAPSSGITTFAINGGTGPYRSARGLITETQVVGTRNSDLSIVVLPSSS